MTSDCPTALAALKHRLLLRFSAIAVFVLGLIAGLNPLIRMYVESAEKMDFLTASPDLTLLESIKTYIKPVERMEPVKRTIVGIIAPRQ